jgi:serralysin
MFQKFADVSLLTFSEITESASANGNIRLAVYEPDLGYNGQVQIPFSDASGSIITETTTSSFANFPWADTYNAGDVFFSGVEFLNASNLENDPYYADTILHEIGHALGLSHPHDTIGNYASNAATVTKPDTIMAYAHYDGDITDGPSPPSYSKPTTLMVSDIEAIQYLYGVNEQHETGDNVYMLSSFSTKNWIYATIWDAGGNDTFSWADQSTVANIDLRGGEYSFFGKIESQSDSDLKSEFGPGDGLLGIAKNVLIENAIGGSNSDTIVGNEADNIIYGGAGAGVKDILTGGAGADIFICSIDDASTDLNLADVIMDFTKGSDKIGLEDITVSELSWAEAAGGTKIFETETSKILFYLNAISFDTIDTSDFLQTNFV